MSLKTDPEKHTFFYINKIPSLWLSFLVIFISFYLIPSSLLFLNYSSNNILPSIIFDKLSSVYVTDLTLKYYFLSPFLFLMGFLVPKFASLFVLKRKSDYQLYKETLKFRNILFKPIVNTILLGGIIGLLIVVFYFLFIATNLLSELGNEELIQASFRMILYDEQYRYANYILEITRRILLPICTSYLIFQSVLMYGRLSFQAKFFWFILFFSGIMTLDRGPVFISLALLILYFFFKAKSIKDYLFYFIILSFLMLLIGGLVTNLQYNNTDISVINIIGQGIAVIVNRLFFDPALMSLSDSFAIIDGINDPLNLRYSRLGVLWGQEYVGTSGDNSIYVAPVSFIGDIWRNLGIFPMPIFGFVISLFLMFCSILFNRTILFLKLPIVFLLIIWSFYIIAGNIFSIGPAAILFLIFILLIFGKAKI